MDTLKILFTFTPAFDPNDGGVQRTTWKLGQYFAEHGYEVGYYSLAKEEHVEVRHGKLYHAPEHGKNKNTANIKHLKQVVSDFNPNVVINQMPYENELREALSALKANLDYKLLGCLRNSLFNFKNNARETSKRLLPNPLFKLVDNPFGIKLIQTYHWVKHRNQLRQILDHHDYFILLAPTQRQELDYFVGNYKSDKVAVIPNSIPTVHDDLSQKENIILHVGRLNIPQKRSDLLIDFWEKTYSKLPDWKFVVVGDGPYKEKMDKRIDEKNLPRIFMEGFQSPDSYYKMGSIFVMTSAYEGFPNVLLEAQSFGCVPVLFDNYLALETIVEDQENALLVEPFDISAMNLKVQALANNLDRLCDMQKSALENARRFTLKKVGKKWESFFNEIIPK